MNRIIKYFLIVFLLLVQVNKVYALSVNEDNITLAKGNSKTIELYANLENEVTNVEFTLVFSSYDIPAYFKVNSQFVDMNPDGVKHDVVFDEPQSGKVLLGTININVKNNTNVTGGSVTINKAIAKMENGKNIELNNQNVNIKISDEEDVLVDKKEEQDNNLLERIESKIVNIELKKDVFEYNVNIKKDIQELDLKPIVRNDDTKIEISSQKISELIDGKIIITVKNSDIEQKYTIIVNEIKEIKKIEIDERIFKSNNDYKSKWLVFILAFVILFILGLVMNKRK